MTSLDARPAVLRTLRPNLAWVTHDPFKQPSTSRQKLWCVITEHVRMPGPTVRLGFDGGTCRA